MKHIIIAMKILFNHVAQTAPKSRKHRLVFVFQNLQNPNTPGKVNIPYSCLMSGRVCCIILRREGVHNKQCLQAGGGWGRQKTVTALVGYHQEYVKQGKIQVFKNNFFWILRMWFKFNELN